MARGEIHPVSTDIRRTWKLVGTSMLVIGLAGIVWTTSVWYKYQGTLPREPDARAGRIYPLNVHGIVVYQTRQARDWLIEIQYCSFVIVGASILIEIIQKQVLRRS